MNEEEIEKTPEESEQRPAKVLNVVYGPHSFLKRKSIDVSEGEFGETLQPVVNAMFATMKALNEIGLAAVQIGLLKNIITMTVNGDNVPIINPHIISFSEETKEYQEGCSSFPLYMFGTTRRQSVTIRYQDVAGDFFDGTFFDAEAAVLQHELEHLNGVNLLDKLSPLKQNMYKRKFIKLRKKLTRQQAGK